MNIQSAFDSGVAGFNQASERAAESAREIVQQQAPAQTATNVSEGATETTNAVAQTTPITESLINLRLAETQAAASAKVIDTADNALGSLIDTRA